MKPAASGRLEIRQGGFASDKHPGDILFVGGRVLNNLLCTPQNAYHC